MKKTTFTLLLLVFSCRWLAAQCPTGDITFSTQGQIDSFPINYPGCAEMDSSITISGNSIIRLDSLYLLKKIGGKLKISNTGLTSLAGLNQLDSVKSAMKVFNNSSLATLSGLGNLQYVGKYDNASIGDSEEYGFEISDNPQVNTLAGLGKLKATAGCFTISNNENLVSLAGLDSLASVGGCLSSDDHGSWWQAGLVLSGNPLLAQLSGLEKIDSLVKLDITGNLSLTSLEGLSNLQSVSDEVFINGNPSLKSLTGFENLHQIGGILQVSGNNSLTNLNGLEKIDSLRTVYITGNLSLTSLEGLSNLQSVVILSITGNPSLKSLASLENLHQIGLGLTVSDNDSLATLTGLEKIDSLGGIYLSQNLLLASLEGLSNLRSVRGYLYILGNPSLKSLIGLEKLHQIGGSLDVSRNDSLATLSGLENLDSLGKCFKASNNPSLTSLDALNGLKYIGTCPPPLVIFESRVLTLENNPVLTSMGGLANSTFLYSGQPGQVTINNCPNLSVCHLPNVCKHLESGKPATISNNAPGCNNIAEVEAACLVSIEETIDGEPILLLSPNPARNSLQIQINDSEKWEISCFDLQGRQMFRQVVSGSQIIDLKDWPSGIYALRAVSGERAYAGRFIKQ